MREFNFNENQTLSNFDYLFLQIGKIDLYNEKYKKFIESYEKEFDINLNEFIKLINDSEFEIFFNISVNKIFSHLYKENYIYKNKTILNKFSNWSISILEKTNITTKAKEYLKLFYDIEKYIKITSPYFGTLNQNKFEIILFSYKFFFE